MRNNGSSGHTKIKQPGKGQEKKQYLNMSLNHYQFFCIDSKPVRKCSISKDSNLINHIFLGLKQKNKQTKLNKTKPNQTQTTEKIWVLRTSFLDRGCTNKICYQSCLSHKSNTGHMVSSFPVPHECELDFKKAEAHYYLGTLKTPGGNQKPLCQLTQLTAGLILRKISIFHSYWTPEELGRSEKYYN